MSYADEMLNGKKTKRGKSNPARSLDGLGAGKGQAAIADYGDAHPDTLVGIVLEITRRGGAVSLGLSRDKGAFNVTLMLDGERRTVWISSAEDVDAKLEEILVYLAALPE